MYNEKTFKNYIFWIQVKRVVLIIVSSIIGAALGIGIGALLKGTLQISTYNNTIIISLTIVFFLFSVLFTAGTGKEVQDGYWKIAVLRKLTAIQKTLETSNELLESENNKSKLNEIMRNSVNELEKMEDDKFERIVKRPE